MCGWTRVGSRPAFSASRRRIRNAPARVSGAAFARSGRAPAGAAGRGTGGRGRGSGAPRRSAWRPIGTTRSLPPLPVTRTNRSSRSTPLLSSPTASETRSPAPYSSSTSAWSRRLRGCVPFAASIRRSASPGESVFGSGFAPARQLHGRGRVVLARRRGAAGGGRSCAPPRSGARSSSPRARLREATRCSARAPRGSPRRSACRGTRTALRGRGGRPPPCAGRGSRRAARGSLRRQDRGWAWS